MRPDGVVDIFPVAEFAVEGFGFEDLELSRYKNAKGEQIYRFEPFPAASSLCDPQTQAVRGL
jgi:hypothetical protein